MPSFAEYVGARWGALLRVAHLLIGNSASAEDLVPATLVKVYLALPPRQRAVLVLRYYEGLPEAETAQVLAISTGTVKSQAHAALRVCLTDTDPQTEVTL